MSILTGVGDIWLKHKEANTMLTHNTVQTAMSEWQYNPSTDEYINQLTGQRKPRLNDGSITTSDSYLSDITLPSARRTMLSMRLRGNYDFQYLDTAYAGDKVFVFVVQNNQPVVLEDEACIYPSDNLIVQLRLISK